MERPTQNSVVEGSGVAYNARSRDEPGSLSPASRDNVEVNAEMRTPTKSQRVELADFEEFEDFGHGTKCDTWPMSNAKAAQVSDELLRGYNVLV